MNIDNLGVWRIKVQFLAPEEVRMRHWIGAVLRNRFLYAAESVADGQGVSLRCLMDRLPLPDGHFLYKQLCGGFPKGFLFDCSDLPYESPGFVLEANKTYEFSLLLIGNCARYMPLFLEAVRKMITSGFGHPIVPMSLVGMGIEELDSLLDAPAINKMGELDLLFKTPVCLMHLPKEDSNGFQNKLNNFPSFYQFMRSLSYRLVTLSILYADDRTWETRQQIDEQIEQYIHAACKAVLLKADLLYAKRYSTPKKNGTQVYCMDGYAGKLVFGHVSSLYLPLLNLGSVLGVGSYINYGLGMFNVRFRSE